MHLKRLEIYGFKSFANKTVLEFEKGITSIVGPNGSGKSNIADAIRWVLGEQSMKQIRGKKSEDVIFAGSEKKSRLSYAEVSVTFDNHDRKIPIDYPEVALARRMDRSGESEYLINGNKVRLLDIVDLVLKSNIGTSRYTVIGQGTIDQMILAGPAEVKNLIDEASGVKTYYIRREKTLKRLETTTQNLLRVQDLLAEIEPRLKSLRRQAKKMEERSVIEQELKVYQSEFYSSKYWHLEDELNSFNSKISVLVQQRTELEKEIDKFRKNLDKNEHENRSEIQEYQKIQQEIKKLTESKNKLSEDIALIRGRLKAEKAVGTGDVKSLEIEKSSLEAAKNKLVSDMDRNKSGLSGVTSQLEQQNKLFAEVSAKLAEIQAALDNPEKVNFEEIADNVNALDKNFAEFYDTLENSSEISRIIALAQSFKEKLSDFKNKTLELVKNPFLNFEKQRKSLQEILFQKDKITQELNRLDLERSKIFINEEYLQRELVKTEQKLLQVNLELQQLSASNVDDYFKDLLTQEQKLGKEILKITEEVSNLELRINEYHTKEQSRKNEILDEERLYRAKQDHLSKIKDQESVLQIEKAKLETQKENVIVEAHRALGDDGLKKIQSEKLIGQVSGLEEKIRKMQSQLEMIGGIDELTLKEYQETEQRYTYLDTQVTDLQKAMEDLRAVIEELDVYIKKQFSDAFARVDEKFQGYFRILFNGGRAYLSLLKAKEEKKEEIEGEEQQEETSEEKLRPEEKMLAKYENVSNDIIGIDIKATPPGKKLASISALSGGERALTSIALLCALLSCFPSPFVVLDEVDAALDEANTIRFAQILGTLADDTQFITVTHNRETMRKAHTLYGVTMGDDSISKILSIKIDQAQVYAK